jgi:Ca-activated chloride channel family protein
MTTFFLQDPWWLLLMLCAVVAAWVSKTALRDAFGHGCGFLLAAVRPTVRVRFARLLWAATICAMILLAFAAARPRASREHTRVKTQAVDIVMALDVSGSMRAEDFTAGAQRINRLAAAKKVVEEFVKARASDRISLLAFAGKAYSVSPLTTDRGWVIDQLRRMEIGIVKEDGTAVGSAIATALNRLKNATAKTKLIILLTDGRNNTGSIAPEKAADIAKSMGVKIYTVGAGTKGLAPYPVEDVFGRKMYQQIQADLDEKSLSAIAQTTGGMYFYAGDMQRLRDVYAQIDKLETTPIEEEGYAEYRELFVWFALAALVLLMIESVLAATYLRVVP